MPENNYQVTQIDETSVLDEAKNPVWGQRIWFRFNDGQRGHVDIPDHLLTPERKDAMIQAYIDRIMSIWV